MTAHTHSIRRRLNPRPMARRKNKVAKSRLPYSFEFIFILSIPQIHPASMDVYIISIILIVEV
jgi:hypothetical protein